MNTVMRTPRTVDIALTGRCNLRCRYCSHFSSAGEVRDLPVRSWLAFCRELKENAVLSACLQGGEPLLYPGFRAVVRGLVDANMRFSVLSNGTLITDPLARFLSGTGRCDYVQVSLDAAAPAGHDFARGRGSFARALRGYARLRGQGVSVTVRVTIHRGNVHQLPEIARFLLEDLGLDSFGTNSASHLGLCRSNAAMVQLTATERSLAMRLLLDLDRQYPGRISAQAGPLAEARRWQQVQLAQARGERSLPGGGFLTGCGGMWEKIAVRADGMLVPCLMLPHLELGRINRVSLREVWQQHPVYRALRRRHRIPLTKFRACRTCTWRNFCTGNCPGIAATMLGAVDRPSPDACLQRFLADGGELPVLPPATRTRRGPDASSPKCIVGDPVIRHPRVS